MASDQSRSRHIAVIGAGTVGSSCAWHLVRAGFEVSLIDPVEPGQSTSFGNAGCVSPSHITPFSYPGVTWDIPGWLFDRLGPLSIRWRDLPGLAPWFWRFWRSATWQGVDWSSRAQARLMNHVTADFDEILAETGQSHMRQSQGAIGLFDDPAAFKKVAWQYKIKDELGFEWQHLGRDELKIMVPELEFEGGLAVYYPDWQHVLDPGGITAGIARACFDAGGHWLQDRVVSVQASEQGAGLTLESGQELSVDALVVAAGAWSNQIVKQLDYRLPLTPKRGYHTMIAEPGVSLAYPVNSYSRSFVMTPMQDGLRLAGTAEFAALDAPPDYRRAKALLEHARHYLPGLQSHTVTEWMGQRPMMADSVPVISRSPSHGNVFYAFGHGHYGLTQGPTTGRIITDLVSGREPDIDIADYRFSRFRD